MTRASILYINWPGRVSVSVSPQLLMYSQISNVQTEAKTSRSICSAKDLNAGVCVCVSTVRTPACQVKR